MCPQPEALPAPLAARLDALAATVVRLEARIAALEGHAPLQLPAPELPLPEVVLPTADLPNPVRLMGLIGRVCLVLGGATFIRALVDAGTIHRGWGVALGLAYAITWAVLADRVKPTLDASFHALASILIAYPLLVESTAHFGILPPSLTAVLLLAVTCLHAAVAWRRDFQPIMWAATLASLGAGFAIMAARQSIEPFLAIFIFLGIGSLWLTYGNRWHGLRWPTALSADLGVLVLTTLAAWSGGPPEAYRSISPARAMLFAVTLVVLYIGSFSVRMFQRRRRVTFFESVQTALVLLVGVGGSLRIALATGSGAGWLGAGVTLAGLGCYAAAAPFREEQAETRANFNFFTFLALVLLLVGAPIILPLPAFAPLCGLLGLVAMLMGLRLERAVLMLQSAIYLLAAAVTSGLATSSFHTFLNPAAPGAPLTAAGLTSLAAVSMTLALFLLRRPLDPVTVRIRPVILALGALAATGLGALVIRACYAATTAGVADPGLLAVIRTAVMSILAIALAWSGRRVPILELRWLVYPMLIITALKFLFEDLAVGRPLTLFLGFMCYGATLIFAPRLLKVPHSRPEGGDSDPSMPEVNP